MRKNVSPFSQRFVKKKQKNTKKPTSPTPQYIYTAHTIVEYAIQ